MKTKVIHSQSKSVWYVIGTALGGKYKIAICPYVVCEHEHINTMQRKEAFKHATFISKALNQ